LYTESSGKIVVGHLDCVHTVCIAVVAVAFDRHTDSIEVIACIR
jgi:hypothetical protein